MWLPGALLKPQCHNMRQSAAKLAIHCCSYKAWKNRLRSKPRIKAEEKPTPFIKSQLGVSVPLRDSSDFAAQHGAVIKNLILVRTIVILVAEIRHVSIPEQLISDHWHITVRGSSAQH